MENESQKIVDGNDYMAILKGLARSQFHPTIRKDRLYVDELQERVSQPDDRTKLML